MSRFLGFHFWNTLARTILRNRILILVIIAVCTVLLALQWTKMRFSHTEANLLPDQHPINLEYQEFTEKFGEEGNLVLLAIKDSALFSPEVFQDWKAISRKLEQNDEVAHTVSLSNLKVLTKQEQPARFEFLPLIEEERPGREALHRYSTTLVDSLPFFRGLVYSPSGDYIQTALYLDKEIINSPVRKRFILQKLLPAVKEFEEKHGLEVHVSGMPYIRTLNSKYIIDEIGMFIGAALLVTSLLFFFFFRSVRATVISMITVSIGVMWAFGFLGLLNYEITILTAIIPPLIIVIGIPNCIFLINKYQQEISKHGNQARSLQRVITRVGNATLLTNLTTASGFATFILTDSKLLREFGLIASINVLAIFILSLLIIPIIYSFLRIPREKHLRHLNKRWISGFTAWMEQMVKQRRISIFIFSILLLIISIIGIYKIRISGSLLEDLPTDAAFFQDIRFFEREFEGVMPLEFVIDTKRERGVQSLSNLKRMDQLHEIIGAEAVFSDPISVVNLIKYAKQAFYNGNPEYYQLPSSQEQHFILPYLRSLETGQTDILSSYVDSTGRYARVTTFMKDIGTQKMESIEEDLWPAITRIFPDDRFEVKMTGKAFIFQQGTKYLIKNLMISLGLAVFLIALLMAWMFRSWRMILVSLVPNLLPLLMTAGMMGFLGIPIKPSTILVFSIAFGISVDDTIHFLAKYRQELLANNWKVKRSVYAALRETGVSMFYTSIVLFFGFSIFMISSFGGTIALGGLVSATLLFAMLANLLLLPALLLSLHKEIANEEVLKEPLIDILAQEGDRDEEE